MIDGRIRSRDGPMEGAHSWQDSHLLKDRRCAEQEQCSEGRRPSDDIPSRAPPSEHLVRICLTRRFRFVFVSSGRLLFRLSHGRGLLVPG